MIQLRPSTTAFLQDLRYAIRTLRRTAALSLVIAIGANTAIFSVVNALLLTPLRYPDPDRLAMLWLRSPGINIPQDWPSPLSVWVRDPSLWQARRVFRSQRSNAARA